MKKMPNLIELGAIAALIELMFWGGLFIVLYKYNRREKNVQ